MFVYVMLMPISLQLIVHFVDSGHDAVTDTPVLNCVFIVKMWSTFALMIEPNH